MPARWRISFWPPCQSHVFLSHCAEDREDLVLPVFKALRRRSLIPWIDRHHYPLGREAIAALQEELLTCRHVAYFVTPAMLRQGRGWTAAERALAGVIQQQLRHGEELAHVEIPLFFVDRTDAGFQRSIWRSLVDKGEFCPHAVAPVGLGGRIQLRQWQSEHVKWAADVLKKFVHKEEKWSLQLATRFENDLSLNELFGTDPELRRRLLAQSPVPLKLR